MDWNDLARRLKAARTPLTSAETATNSPELVERMRGNRPDPDPNFDISPLELLRYALDGFGPVDAAARELSNSERWAFVQGALDALESEGV